MKRDPLLLSIMASNAAGHISLETRDLIAALSDDAETRVALVELLTRHQFRHGPKRDKLAEQADARNRFLDLRERFGRREARLRIKTEAPEHFEMATNPNGRVRRRAREKKNRTSNLSGLLTRQDAD